MAIGGIVTREIPRQMYEKLFPYFIATAHKKGVKIHGLGYTDTTKLDRFKFDSVDSSTWTCGRRFGEAAWFDGRQICRRKARNSGMKIKDTTKINWFSFREWVKFTKYAENHL